MRKAGTVLAGPTPIWRCDDCGGAAVWTFIDGVVHYHCEHQCEGFMQRELFETSGVVGSTRGGDALDAGRPTSDIDEPEGLPF